VSCNNLVRVDSGCLYGRDWLIDHRKLRRRVRIWKNGRTSRSDLAFASFFSSRATMATCAPCWTSSLENARPRPELPPGTKHLCNQRVIFGVIPPSPEPAERDHTLPAGSHLGLPQNSIQSYKIDRVRDVSERGEVQGLGGKVEARSNQRQGLGVRLDGHPSVQYSRLLTASGKPQVGVCEAPGRWRSILKRSIVLLQESTVYEFSASWEVGRLNNTSVVPRK
jgi:hypothetical protein